MVNPSSQPASSALSRAGRWRSESNFHRSSALVPSIGYVTLILAREKMSSQRGRHMSYAVCMFAATWK